MVDMHILTMALGVKTDQLRHCVEARTGTAANPRKQASKQPVGWAFPRTGGRRRSGAGEERKRCLRVDEDDVGVALHGLGEQGACGAAANHHHPRLLPRPRHRRAGRSPPRARRTQLTSSPSRPAHAALLTKQLASAKVAALEEWGADRW